MEVRIMSIREARKKLKEEKVNNIKGIIVSSYHEDIEEILNENKLLIYFDDIAFECPNSFNTDLAKKIDVFINSIDIENNILYICCDSGISRSSAIAAAILRKYKKNEMVIWKDFEYNPNMLVYKLLCKEFGLKNNKLRLRYLENVNKKALKTQINKNRERNIFAIIGKLIKKKYMIEEHKEIRNQ